MTGLVIRFRSSITTQRGLCTQGYTMGGKGLFFLFVLSQSV